MFETQLLEDWFEPMYRAIDTTADSMNMGPIHDNRWGICMLYYFFIFLMAFLVTNMFISILISSFEKQHYRKLQLNELTPQSKSWIDCQKFMLESEPIAIL